MFEVASNNFTICIKENENIPNIYNSIYNKIIRDCNSTCYGFGNERNSTSNKKSCCNLYEYEYNNNCYSKCPSKTTSINSTNKCQHFYCSNYYNYEQDDCIDNIPDGFYQNDTNTIDKCHKDCKICNRGPNDYSTNCLSCNDDKPFVYLGNCYTSCHKGSFINSGIKKCICHETKCKECTIESLEYDLCVSCNDLEGYYEKLDDINNKNISFKNCYKEPEKYYLNLSQKIYIPCYPSCKSCTRLSYNKMHHYCTSCSEENNYSILDESAPIYINCYPECKYYYYFDNDYNYNCTDISECPQSYPFLIENTKQCIKECKNLKKIWQFRHTCFEQCPSDSKNYINETGFYCNVSCPFERPFEIIRTEYCVSSCKIMERYNKLCITNYDGDRNNEVQDMILSDFQEDIIDTFEYTNITENHSIIYEEKNIIYEITSSNCTYINPKTTTIDLRECENILKNFYNIDLNESLYIFKFDAFVEGKAGPKVEYEVYYPLDKNNLQLLDLDICEGEKIFIGYPLNISEDELDLYNSDSDFYNDICYPYTNSKGTDITLNDRQIEYANNNKNLCDENCKYSGYDKEKRRLICSCEIKSSISLISQIEVDKNKLYNFIDLKQMANFKVMKCFNLLFSKKGLKNNIGFYSFFPTIFTYITALFLFCFLEFKIIIGKINEIIASIKIMKSAIDKKNESRRRKKKNSLEEKSYFKWKRKKYMINKKNFHVQYLAQKEKEKKIKSF